MSVPHQPRDLFGQSRFSKFHYHLLFSSLIRDVGRPSLDLNCTQVSVEVGECMKGRCSDSRQAHMTTIINNKHHSVYRSHDYTKDSNNFRDLID